MKKLIPFICLSIFCSASFAQEQLVNASFENWSINKEYNYEELSNWWGASINCTQDAEDNIICNATTVKTTDAYSGTYASKLINMQSLSGTDVQRGLLMYIKEDGYYDFSSKPTKLTGYYKFNNAGSDNIDIDVSLTRANGTEAIAYGSLTLKITKSEYTVFSIPITYLSTTKTPESIVVSISFNDKPNLSSTFTVDALNLEYATTPILSASSADAGAHVFPNPATDKLSFEHPVQHISIKTGNGIEVLNIIEETKNIHIASLLPGIYILSYQYSGQLIHTKLVKE